MFNHLRFLFFTFTLHFLHRYVPRSHSSSTNPVYTLIHTHTCRECRTHTGGRCHTFHTILHSWPTPGNDTGTIERIHKILFVHVQIQRYFFSLFQHFFLRRQRRVLDTRHFKKTRLRTRLTLRLRLNWQITSIADSVIKDYGICEEATMNGKKMKLE